MTGSRALVTGATGAIGPTLVAHLLDAGYQVRALSRTPPAPGLLPPAAEYIPGTITDSEAVRRAVAGVDVVFHLAALLHIENPAPDLAADYARVNVDGARSVAEAAAAAGARRFVYFSTVKVYGVRQREPVTEAQPPQPETIYARTKLLGEEAVRAVASIETVALRLSPVYGPRLRGSWARLVRAIAQNRFVPVGDLRNVHSLTHVDDVARAALLAAQHPGAAGGVYNLVAHENPTMGDILIAIYAACGRPLPPLRVPGPVALAGAFTLERGLRLAGRRSPLPVAAVRQLIEDEAYSGAALRALGFTPGVALGDGWPVSAAHG